MVPQPGFEPEIHVYRTCVITVFTIGEYIQFWSARLDLNQRPLPSKGSRLPDCPTHRHVNFLVGTVGFEPTTP